MRQLAADLRAEADRLHDEMQRLQDQADELLNAADDLDPPPAVGGDCAPRGSTIIGLAWTPVKGAPAGPARRVGLDSSGSELPLPDHNFPAVRGRCHQENGSAPAQLPRNRNT
jgi:hypothetical protein